MKNKDFAVFILSHGRPNNVYTFDALKRYGYTGRIIIIIDNEDKTQQQYINKFGSDNVVIFNKQEIAKTTDQGDNLNDLRTTTHARNAIFQTAKQMNIKYFIQLDDDYTNFRYRFMNDRYTTKGSVTSLDVYLDIILDLFININCKSISIAQGGDFIGGEGCGMISNYRNMSRKCMNSFICSTDREFKFISRLNEDVNTYMTLGSRGELFLTIPHIALEQKETQKTKGGMSETYLDNGTYQKSFFTVMYCPSFTKVALMGFTKQRLHHSIEWDNAVPCIIDEKHKKQ